MRIRIRDMRTISHGKAVEEISKTEELLKQLGVKNTLFAPPSGYFNQETIQVLPNLNCKLYSGPLIQLIGKILAQAVYLSVYQQMLNQVR